MKTTTAPQLGPRGKYLRRVGVLGQILWHEQYPEDFPGHFAQDRQRIETETVEQLLDRWCRGNNLIGYAGPILETVDILRKAAKVKDGKSRKGHP